MFPELPNGYVPNRSEKNWIISAKRSNGSLLGAGSPTGNPLMIGTGPEGVVAVPSTRS